MVKSDEGHRIGASNNHYLMQPDKPVQYGLPQLMPVTCVNAMLLVRETLLISHSLFSFDIDALYILLLNIRLDS